MSKKYIKGFDKDLKCRGFQFEVGKDYKIELNGREVRTCSDTGFHFCESLQQVHNFYDCNPKIGNRFCEIEVLGDIDIDSDKCASNHIKIVREITGAELSKLKGLERGNTGLFNSGDQNSGGWNSGDQNSGGWNSGYRNSGYWNSGDQNSGDQNSGYLNSGDLNSGYWNSGDQNSGGWNSGDRNSGYRNSGYWNSGDRNSGDRNSGDQNSGDWNKSDGNNGFFNTIEPTVFIFNQDSGITQSEFKNSKWNKALNSSKFVLTKWIYYTDEEKENSIIRQAIGGYLKTYTYKEACANWWSRLNDSDKEIIQTMPNFDETLFEEITGIKTKGENE